MRIPCTGSLPPRRSCRQTRFKPVRSWTRTSFGSRALCLIMARLALPSHLKRSCASTYGAKASNRFGSASGRGSTKPSGQCGGARPTTARLSSADGLSIPLGVLKQHALRTARGQKIAYVVDAAYHEENVGKDHRARARCRPAFYRGGIPRCRCGDCRTEATSYGASSW